MIDWRIIPIMGLLYAVALIDRVNLGIARIAGMEEALVRDALPWQNVRLTCSAATRYWRAIQYRIHDLLRAIHHPVSICSHSLKSDH